MKLSFKNTIRLYAPVSEEISSHFIPNFYTKLGGWWREDSKGMNYDNLRPNMDTFWGFIDSWKKFSPSTFKEKFVGYYEQ